MISDKEIRLIGRFNKPHGISGELSLTLDENLDVDLAALRCIVVKVDDINVPFFIAGLRPRGRDSVLLRIDGVTDERQAADFAMQAVYALRSDLVDADGEEEDPEGFYASDLVGYDVVADGAVVGRIADIDESTENALFVVETPDGATRLIPIADDFITDINPDGRTIEMSLPVGLLDI